MVLVRYNALCMQLKRIQQKNGKYSYRTVFPNYRNQENGGSDRTGYKSHMDNLDRQPFFFFPFTSAPAFNHMLFAMVR